MKPTRCHHCNGDDLAYGGLFAQMGVTFFISLFKHVRIHGAACLACGSITPYLEDDGLARLRKWNCGKKPTKAPLDEF